MHLSVLKVRLSILDGFFGDCKVVRDKGLSLLFVYTSGIFFAFNGYHYVGVDKIGVLCVG